MPTTSGRAEGSDKMYRHRVKREDPPCAICGKPIKFKDRFRFALFSEVRNRYDYEYRVAQDLTLRFHKKCVRQINVKVENLFDLLVVMQKVSKENANC